MISRRKFVKAALTLSGALWLRAQDTSPRFERRAIYAPAVLLDVSPDGRTLALWLLNQPHENAIAKAGRLLKWLAGGRTDVLQLIEASTGAAVFTHALGAYIPQATFFDDSSRVFAALMDVQRARKVRGVVLDLARESVQEYPNEGMEFYCAQSGSNLIREGPPLTLVQLPDYREIQRVDVTPKPFAISRDRSLLAYAVDQSVLVCRRATDLSAVWERPVDAGWVPRDITISSGGRYVIASFSRQSATEARIYEAATGEETGRIPIELNDNRCNTGANEQWIAAGSVNYDPQTKESVSVVHIYALDSGRKIATLEHDRYRQGRRSGESLKSAVSKIFFTADHRTMIVGGPRSTSVWSIVA